MHLMALGMFLFEIGTLPFEELQRRTDWRHARAARVGARDATQFVGVGDETISLSGAVYAELTNGRVSIDELRELADAGEAMPLVDGSGTVYGNFVITALDERHAHLMANGRPMRIDFGLDLLRVDDTPPPVEEGDPLTIQPEGLLYFTDEPLTAGFTHEIGSMAKALSTIGLDAASTVIGIKNVVATLNKGQLLTTAQRSAFGVLGLDPMNMVQRMQDNPGGAILDVMVRLKAMPDQGQSRILGNLFGDDGASAVAPILSGVDQLQKIFHLS